MRTPSSKALLAIVVVVASCSKGTEPPTPTSIQVTPGGTVALSSINQTRQLSAQVLDQHGSAMAGQTVAWSSNLTTVVSVDSTGRVTAKANGSAIVTAAVGTVTQPVTVTVAQAAAKLTKSSGDQEIGAIGAALGSALTLQATDSGGSPAVGVHVAFAVTTGGGSVGTSATTDASGYASVTWTLGGTSATQTVTASAGSATTVFTAHALPAPAAGYQVTVVNIGPPFSAAVQTAFDSATAFWQRAITADLPDIAGFQVAAGQCGDSPAVGPVTVDDILILAKFDSIDGPGKILGQAGPCFIRTTGFLTIMGIMEFDTADVEGLVAAGSLNSVIRHEMGHVLGFGTLWGQGLFNYLQNPSSTGNLVDTYFNGPRSLVVFDSIGGTSYTGGNKVPVENCVGIAGCGAGTFNAHWRESVFFNELMTGYLNSGVPNPLSVLTLASMQDLGYSVNLAAAEPYSRTFSSAPALMAEGGAPYQRIELGDDVMHLPIRVVDSRGRIVGVWRAP